MQKLKTKIIISKYELEVFIGISQEERTHKQKIILIIEIFFTEVPQAINSDNIKDTICYYNLCNKLKQFNNKVYCTIEFLAQQIFELLNNIIYPNSLRLEVKKFPMIENLKGDISFVIENCDK
ncbi:dihydroneopterin aldolase [Rickettsiales endosymbiont of Trichoplax sp. H2]|uniref:dihydroneopterin aldolase n=1 Tax=Rickettsiales endosymbiont of Trichoplax sp. H2 TaxID=2021221 RepID=UPI0012B2C478|nr:dihydroneopterin aldolase [Rickettsiales endosymbiont of Trichoplax sp. H2]MSO13416.1 putative dihydroneopterin aldolase [Rickettsiales endosymbiont of Trichoplax sp. H2]